MTPSERRSAPLRGGPALGMTGLLVVTMVVGYEWLVSGLAKFAAGDFPGGLGAELTEKAGELSGWYADFLTRVAIPNAPAFGYVIQISELLAGLALIGGPLLWLFAWERLSDGLRHTAPWTRDGSSTGQVRRGGSSRQRFTIRDRV